MEDPLEAELSTVVLQSKSNEQTKVHNPYLRFEDVKLDYSSKETIPDALPSLNEQLQRYKIEKLASMDVDQQQERIGDSDYSTKKFKDNSIYCHSFGTLP